MVGVSVVVKMPLPMPMNLKANVVGVAGVVNRTDAVTD